MKRLLWFTHGFIAAHAQRREDGGLRLILADLRMGLEPDYFFRYDIAGIDGRGHWAAAEITQLPESGDTAKTLSWVWRRIYDSKATP